MKYNFICEKNKKKVFVFIDLVYDCEKKFRL